MSSVNTQVEAHMEATERRVLDLSGIAEFLGVAPTTPQQWRQRNQLPPPEPDSFPDKPFWRIDTIVAWAQATNRWPPGSVARTRRSS